ncbi:MAG: hypothetical protein FJ033_16835 [Chloroflexi bacterium]|nr:hypothetical protein [Chloroflexota bacterium]
MARRHQSRSFGGAHPEIPPDVREAFIDDVLTLEPKRLLAPHRDGESLRPVLREMPVATLVLFGDRDEAMDPGDCARACLDLPPERRHLHVFHDVGHSVNAEVPKALARTLRRFIDRVYPAP